MSEERKSKRPSKPRKSAAGKAGKKPVTRLMWAARVGVALLGLRIIFNIMLVACPTLYVVDGFGQ